MKKVLLDGADWKPVHPLTHKIRKSGKGWTVEVAFYAPCPPLVLDTKTVDDPGNYGFSLVGAEGEDIAIKSVRLVGKNAVQLLTEKDPGKGRLRYGMTINEHRPSGPRTGARGCLRDSQGDEVKAHIQGKDYRMDNWCPFFDYLSKGPLFSGNGCMIFFCRRLFPPSANGKGYPDGLKKTGKASADAY